MYFPVANSRHKNMGIAIIKNPSKWPRFFRVIIDTPIVKADVMIIVNASFKRPASCFNILIPLINSSAPKIGVTNNIIKNIIKNKKPITKAKIIYSGLPEYRSTRSIAGISGYVIPLKTNEYITPARSSGTSKNTTIRPPIINIIDNKTLIRLATTPTSTTSPLTI